MEILYQGNMPNSSIAKSKTLSIMLTYKCTARCKDCGTFSSPADTSRNELSSIISVIDEAKELGFSNVVFTGGEATIEWDNLIFAIKHASSLGFPTRLVTNGHWATDPVVAKEKIQILQLAGLDEINYSTGHEHLKYIPIGHIINAVVASIRSCLVTVLMFELRSPKTISLEEITEKIYSRCDDNLCRKFFKTIESPWMPTKPMEKSHTPEETLTNKNNIACRTGCDSILQTYVLQGDGKISSCCGLGMRTIPELHVSNGANKTSLRKSIEKSEEDWFKIALRYIGPEKLLAWAAEKNDEIIWENLYAHRCHACIRIYRDSIVKKTIRENFSELYSDLILSIYIDEELTPNIAQYKYNLENNKCIEN